MKPRLENNQNMRTHYSKEPIAALRAVEQSPEEHFKPTGLWYSVDGDWERWCEGEEFGGIDTKLRYELKLADENVLRLTTPADILVFHQRFAGGPIYPGSTMRYPDWSRLAGEYDGLEIAPYQWSLRLDQRVHWYYSWDCASGCLWRPRGATIVLSGGEQ